MFLTKIKLNQNFHICCFLIFCIASVTGGRTCITNCTSLLRHSLNSIVGGYKASAADMLAPLHFIIKQSANNVVVRRKTEWICLSIEKFKRCSDDCHDNRQKMVELANVGHWGTICRALFSNPKSFSEFISCLRRHMEEVGKRCEQRNWPGEMSNLRRFCGKMREYTKCHSGIRLACSPNATNVYRQITRSIGQSFYRIQQLSRGHLKIPDDCQVPFEENAKEIVDQNGFGHGNDTDVQLDYWIDMEEEYSGIEGKAGARSKALQQFGFLLLFSHLILPMIFIGFSEINYLYAINIYC